MNKDKIKIREDKKTLFKEIFNESTSVRLDHEHPTKFVLTISPEANMSFTYVHTLQIRNRGLLMINSLIFLMCVF